MAAGGEGRGARCVCEGLGAADGWGRGQLRGWWDAAAPMVVNQALREDILKGTRTKNAC